MEHIQRPDFVQRAKQSPRLVCEECLCQAPLPDIIALQECPYPEFGEREFADSGYVSMGTQESHCGYVDLLVRKDLMTRNAQPITMLKQHDLPSVAATIDLPNKEKIAVSSSHLEPFKEGAFERHKQCATLMALLSQEADNCIHLGDFNMRAAEDVGIENASGGGWIDAWKETGSNPEVKFPWNSFVNGYHEGAFKFRARFDRCYLRGASLSVKNFGLIGNRPVATKGDYLSDHFGLLVGVDVAASDVREAAYEFLELDDPEWEKEAMSLTDAVSHGNKLT